MGKPWLKASLHAGLRNYSTATDLHINAVRGRSHLHSTIRNIGPKLQSLAVQIRVSVQRNNYIRHFIPIYFFLWHDTASGPWPPHYRGFAITFRNTAIGRTPKPEAETSNCQHTTHTRNRHPCPGKFRNRSPKNQVAADPRLRPLGHRDRL